VTGFQSLESAGELRIERNPLLELFDGSSIFDAGHLQGHIELRARRQGGDDEGTSLQALAATWTGTRIDD
jgi:hypothetical protein